MRFAVIGTGGIGGPYGASLAKAGADVTFVARGSHLAAIREDGLRIEGDRGETYIRPAQATDGIASIGIVDYVLLCVKLWDVAVIPLQNGIDVGLGGSSTGGRPGSRRIGGLPGGLGFPGCPPISPSA
jgi:2-dehydropantoate 2-reductase